MGRDDTHFVLPGMETFSFQQGSVHKVQFGCALRQFIIPRADTKVCNHFQVAEENFEIKVSNFNIFSLVSFARACDLFSFGYNKTQKILSWKGLRKIIKSNP